MSCMMNTLVSPPDPKVGEDGLVFEDRPLPMSVLQALPTEVGLWKTSAVYTNIEANDSYLVVGSEQGVVWVVDLETSTLIREYSVSVHHLYGAFGWCG